MIKISVRKRVEIRAGVRIVSDVWYVKELIDFGYADELSQVAVKLIKVTEEAQLIHHRPQKQRRLSRLG